MPRATRRTLALLPSGGSVNGGPQMNLSTLRAPRSSWKAMRFSFHAPMFAADSRRSDQVDRHVDVAARGLRVRADLLSFIHQSMGDGALDAGQADAEAGAEDVAAVSDAQVDLGVDGSAGRKGDLPPVGHKPDRPLEADRPAVSEQ